MGTGIVHQLEKEFDIEPIWLGLEIHPDTPEEGVNLNDRFGTDRLTQLSLSIKKSCSNYNLVYDPLPILVNSRKAFLAAEFARENGKYDVFHDALMKAYFAEGKDIGKIEVLRNLAESIGLSPDELAQSLEENRFADVLEHNAAVAQKLGIHSTPTFLIGDHTVIQGAQDISIFRKALTDMKF